MTNPPAAPQVVHLDFIALSDTATPEAVEDLIAEAAGLSQLGSVQVAGVIETEPGSSDFDLAFFFVLDGFTSLEPFGTNPLYIRFLQGKVSRLLRAFAGADVALTAPFPEVQSHAVCLALMAPDQTYDWEVRNALESWAAAGPETAIGLAIGERQRYRGCVLSFTTSQTAAERPADRRFESTLIAGRAVRL